MRYRLAPNKKSIRFIGDNSIIVLNRYGVAWQEIPSDIFPGFIDCDILNGNQTEQLKELATSKGAFKYLTTKRGEERWTFRQMPITDLEEITESPEK